MVYPEELHHGYGSEYNENPKFLELQKRSAAVVANS
jgi:hypothetical protein